MKGKRKRDKKKMGENGVKIHSKKRNGKKERERTIKRK